MANLASTLLSLTSVVEKLSELGPVKQHLFRASREILLAVQSLLGFVEDYVSKNSHEKSEQQMISGAIAYAQKTIRTIVKQLPHVDEEAYQLLHRKVMSSILEVLEVEIRSHTRKTSQKSKLKVEVFQAIRNVLLREMYDKNSEEENENLKGGSQRHDHTD